MCVRLQRPESNCGCCSLGQAFCNKTLGLLVRLGWPGCEPQRASCLPLSGTGIGSTGSRLALDVVSRVVVWVLRPVLRALCRLSRLLPVSVSLV